MAADKGQHHPSSGAAWPEQNQTGIPIRRIRPHVCDALIHGKEGAAFVPYLFKNNRIAGSTKAFLDYRFSLIALRPEIGCDFGREVFVNLEVHSPSRGSRLSSLASSAAYATAASICSGLREG